MQDPLILSHRELRAALRLCQRELKKSTLTKNRARLMMIVGRTLDQAKRAAVAFGASKIPLSASEIYEGPQQSPPR